MVLELKDGLDILNWRFLELRVVAKTFEGSVTNCRNVKNHILSKYLWFSQVQFFKKSIFIRARLPRSSTYQWSYQLLQPQRLCHQLKYLSPFNVSKFLGIFTIWYEAYHMTQLRIQKLRWTLNQNVVGVSLRNETFTLNMKLVTKWDLKSSLSEHDRGRPWLTAV